MLLLRNPSFYTGLSLVLDLCFFAPPQPNSTIADTEGDEVAWCTTDTHGTRVIPPDAIQGIQVLNNANYMQIVMFLDQTKVNIQAGDYGGELDPGGQDLVSA